LQPKSSNEGTTFNLCVQHYTVPTDGVPLCSPVLSADDIKGLESMSNRIDAHEQRYIKNKEVLLDKLEENRNELHKSLKDKFLDSLEAAVQDLQRQTNAYYESVTDVSALLCQTALRRLHIEISDEQKVKSVLQEIVNEHRGQKNVELVLPAGFAYQSSELPLPESWEVSRDPNVAPYECRLKLDFGEVVGNFDESFKVLHELVGGHE